MMSFFVLLYLFWRLDKQEKDLPDGWPVQHYQQVIAYLFFLCLGDE